jgi:hypothetical protein
VQYKWENNQSLIEEVTILGDGKKKLREALIYAPASENSTNAALWKLDDALIAQGYNVSYDMKEGRPLLRVTGIQNPDLLIKFLQQNRFVSENPPTKEAIQKEKKSTLQTIRDNSLTFAAAFYMAGNFFAIMSGLFRKDKHERNTGLAFTVGDGAMLLFGKRSERQKNESLLKDFGTFLKKNGIESNFGSYFADAAVKKPASNWDKIKDFMHDKVILIKSASEITAGINFARAGVKQNNPYKIGAGTAIASGFALSLGMPEKTNAELRAELGDISREQVDKEIKNMPFFKRIYYKIQKMPLILSAFFTLTNNMLTFRGAYEEAKNQWQLKEVAARLGGPDISPELDNAIAELSSPHGESRGYNQVFPWGKKFHKVDNTAYDTLHNSYNELQSANNGADRAAAEKKYASAKKEYFKLKQDYHNLTTPNKVMGVSVHPKNFWVFNVLQTSMFVIANFLYATSSKSGKGSQTLNERFLSSVATEVNRAQTAEHKQQIISLAAQYMGKKKELDFTHREAQQAIIEHLEKLQENPWLQKHLNRSTNLQGHQANDGIIPAALLNRTHTQTKNPPTMPADGEIATGDHETAPTTAGKAESTSSTIMHELKEKAPLQRKEEAEKKWIQRTQSPQSRLHEAGHAAGMEM